MRPGGKTSTVGECPDRPPDTATATNLRPRNQHFVTPSRHETIRPLVLSANRRVHQEQPTCDLNPATGFLVRLVPLWAFGIGFPVPRWPRLSRPCCDVRSLGPSTAIGTIGVMHNRRRRWWVSVAIALTLSACGGVSDTTTATTTTATDVPTIVIPETGETVIAVQRSDGAILPYGFPEDFPMPSPSVTNRSKGYPGLGSFVSVRTELASDDLAHFVDDAINESDDWDFARLVEAEPLPGFHGDWTLSHLDRLGTQFQDPESRAIIEIVDESLLVTMMPLHKPTAEDITAILPDSIPRPDEPINDVKIYSGSLEVTWNGDENTVQDLLSDLGEAGWTGEGDAQIGLSEIVGQLAGWEVVILDFGHGRLVTLYSPLGIEYWPRT